jgi:hypothetical protein
LTVAEVVLLTVTPLPVKVGANGTVFAWFEAALSAVPPPVAATFTEGEATEADSPMVFTATTR